MAEQKKNTRKIYFIIGGILCLLILSYIGISVFFMKHFLFNTEINSQNFSAKTAAHAEKVLKKQVQEYELTILGKNNQTDIMKGSDISLVYKENDQLKNILKKQNAFSWPLSLFSKKSASISIDLDYNKDGARI
ncbi:hypothetical protein HGO97_021805 [Faecalicatena sp. AGMB00832]|uniref:Uncharacterized protein n=1 Tax=Faecalicatena faecalis TaxID=2726362 RepID=A0ABS6DB77_9FIRM|nr:hypothetical protein [Faecalicatena faecalis]MBU3878442.1 hypothetical protein [Faecalicatena faecalis]